VADDKRGANLALRWSASIIWPAAPHAIGLSANAEADRARGPFLAGSDRPDPIVCK